MTLAVIAASLAVFSWKLLGYLVPERYVSNPKFRQLADAITVGLLSALVGIQGFTSDSELTIDSRLPALILAAVLLYLRMPFIVVIAGAAAFSAVIRMLI
ncbi:MAG TPA: AzlD domain-containing protein [Microbacteriaceae bacterium]